MSAARIVRSEWAHVLAIAAAAFVPRLMFLGADPPPDFHFHFISDEGLYAHNARLHALTGHWLLGAYNPALFTAPLHTLLVRASYALFGLGLWQTRLPGAVAGALVCLVAYGFVRREASRGAAFLAALLLASSYFLATNSRVAFTESLQALFVTIAVLAVLRSRVAPGWAVAGAAALCAALASKVASLPAVAVIAAQYGVMWRAARDRPDARSAVRRSLGAFAASASAIGVLVAVTVVLPHARTVAAAFADASRVAVAGIPGVGPLERVLWFGYRDEPGSAHVLNGFFTQEAALVLAVAVLAATRLLRRDPRPFTPLEAACWLWAAIVLAGIATHPFFAPDRRYVLFAPPLAILIACAAWDAPPASAHAASPGPARTIAAWGVVGLAAGIYLRPALAPAFAAATGTLPIGREPGLSNDLRLAAIWALAFALAAVAIRVGRGRSLAGLPALALVVGIVFVDAARLAAVVRHPRFTVRAAERDFAGMASALPRARRAAVGVTAATLSLESDVICVPVETWPGRRGPRGREDVARLEPAFVVVTGRNGRRIGGDEGFDIGGLPVLRVDPLWPDAEGRPGLRTTIYGADGWASVGNRWSDASGDPSGIRRDTGNRSTR